MKHLVLVGDGMADFPLPSHGNQTPLVLARTPAMDAIAQAGLTGELLPIPAGMPPGSDVGNLSLLGYDPRTALTGRAPLEAANQRIPIGPDQMPFRCNLVTLDATHMRDFTAGHIGTDEAAALIAALDAALGQQFQARFHAGVSYRHLTIITTHGAPSLDALAATDCTPPHDISDQPYAPHLPSGPASDFLIDLMRRSQPVLAQHPINRARLAAGKRAATSIWLWGQGRPPAIETYPKRFGIDGCVISAVDLVNGIGVCAGLEPVKVPGATGYLDTNYAGKVAAALDALERVDFVYLHVEAPDETSHEGSLELKLRAIEEFDQLVVAPCLAWAKARGDCRILVTPDHITALSTRTHATGPVPFALCGPGVAADSGAAYNEAAAAHAGLTLPGHVLVPYILSHPEITAELLKAAAG